MRQFLRETWELWYWALFRPALLQARMNVWVPMKGDDGELRDTGYSDILLHFSHGRFIAQFMLLSLFFALPLMISVAATGQLGDWVFVLSAILAAYGIALWLLPLGLHVPLLLGLVYALQPDALRQTLAETAAILPPLPQLALGLGFYALGLGFTTGGGAWLWAKQRIWLGRALLLVGSVFTVSAVLWLTTQSWFASLFTGVVVLILVLLLLWSVHDNFDSATASALGGGVTGFMAGSIAVGVALFIARSVVGSLASGVASSVAGGIAIFVASLVAGVIAIGVVVGAENTIKNVMALIVAGVVAGGVAGSVASSVAGSVAGSIVGIAIFPLPPLLLTALLVGFSLAPMRWRWTGLLLAAIFIGLSFERHGWLALAVAAAALVGYYRLLPLYPLFAFRSITARWHLPNKPPLPALPELQQLSPHLDEVLWLPIPGHARLLAAAFREDEASAMAILERMRTSPYPGYGPTLRRALPLIVADQLALVPSAEDLMRLPRRDAGLLPQLVPSFYQFDAGDGARLPVAVPPKGSDDLALLLPRLLYIAEDVGRAYESANPALVERGLERCRDNLRILQGQLLGLGLRAALLPRWQPVFARWEALLNEAIAAQHTLSQGELRNPFQTGNPLRRERKHLFKGRDQFVSDVLRSIYDASRPTLVLHGPRRCGKSSFLLHLPRLLPSDLLPVYYSLQAPAATSSAADFCYGLVRALRRDLAGQGVVLPEAQREAFHANAYAALEDWLDHALPLLGTRSLLLCFDEFEQLGTAVAQGRVTLAVFDQLRELIQHSTIAFLFCGVQTLDELGPQWSSYFISVRPMEMTYLEPAAAEALLTNPDPDFALRYAPGIVEEVLQLTRCQPYLLQLLGEEMVRQANQQQTRLLTPPLLEAAIEGALTAGATPYFTNLWSEYSGTTSEEVAAGQRLLHAIAHGAPLPATEGAAERMALRRLLRYHVIEAHNGGYRCQVPLVARWVRERAELGEAE